MSERGVFAVDRGIWEHDLLTDSEPFSRREAWLWLVSEAAWKPHRRRIVGRPIDLNRGQLVASTRFIASKWRWSEPRVRRFLAALISEGMIGANTDAGVSVITICKYDEYQRVSLPTDAMRESEVDAAATQQRRKVEDKENKEDSEPIGSAASAAVVEVVEPADEDPKAKLFRVGKTTLVSFGVAEKRTGALIGQWLKQRPDPVGLLAAIQYARDQNVAEPVAYISTMVNSAKSPNGQHGKQNLSDLAFELADEFEAAERARRDAGAADRN